MKTLRIFTMFALSCALLSCGNEKDGDVSQLPSPKVIQDEAKTTKTISSRFLDRSCRSIQLQCHFRRPGRGVHYGEGDGMGQLGDQLHPYAQGSSRFC